MPEAFTPAPTVTVTAPTPFSADFHVAPSFDPIELLPERCADRLRALRLRAETAHLVVPKHEQIREASTAKIEAANRLG
jgi:hypothetical protein